MTQATLGAKATPKIRETRLLINNQWVDPVEGGSFDTLNPATGEVIASVAAGGAKDVDKAVKAARRARARPSGATWTRPIAASCSFA